MLRVLSFLIVAAIGPAALAQTSAADALLDAATSLLEGGFYDEAGRTYGLAVEIDRTNLTARAGQIWSAILAGDYEGARRAADAVVAPAEPVGDHDRFGASLIIDALAPLALADGDTLRAFRVRASPDAQALAQVASIPAPPPPSLDPADTAFDDFMAEWRHEYAIRDAGPVPFRNDLDDALFAFATHSPSEDLLYHLFMSAERQRLDALLGSLKADPTMGPTAYVLLARSRSLSQDDEAARVVLEEGARLHPESFDIHVDLGDIQGRTGRAEAALATFRSLEPEHGDSTAVRVGLYRALASTGEEAEARSQLASGGERASEAVAFGRYGLSLCLMRWYAADEPPTAAEVETCATPYLWQDPLWGPTHADLGRAYALREDRAAAIGAFERAARFSPDSLDYAAALGDALMDAGRVEASIEVFHALARRAPRYGYGRQRLGQLLIETDVPAAERHLAAATLLVPNSADAHYALGVARESLGMVEGAIGPYEIARSLAPERDEIRFSLGGAYALLGRDDEAEAELSTLNSMGSDLAGVLESFIRALRSTAIPTSPLGDGWAYATSSSSADFWFREPVRSGTSRATWTASTPAEGETRAFRALYADPLGRSRANRLDRVLERATFDCAGRRSKTHEVIYYDASGTPLDSVRDSYPSWTYPAPGTVGEGLLEALCDGR